MDPDTLFALGTGLMSSAKFGGNLGDSLNQSFGAMLQRKQAKQQIGMGQLQMQQLQQEMPMRMGYLKALGEQLHIANNDPQVGQQLQAATPGQSQQPPAVPALMPSSVPTIPGAPTGFGSAPPIQAPPIQMPPQSAQQAPQQQPQQPGGDPMQLAKLGAFGGALGMQGSQGLLDLSKLQLEHDPAEATRMESAKSQVAQDQYQIQQAQAQGNTTLAAGLQQKMRQDLGLLHIASMSGTQTRIGLGGDISTYNPNEGVQTNNGVESVIPGATQARGQLAAAESVGKAAGETVNLVDPKTGTSYPVPKSMIVGTNGGAAPKGAGGSPLPAGSAPGALVGALGPQAENFLKGRGTQGADYLTAQQTAAEAARDTNYSIDQMLQSSKGVQLGAGAPLRQWGEKWLSGIGQQFGIESSSELSSYQELEKYSNKIAFAATKQMGSREAAQIVTLQMQSNPNKSLTPDAFYGLANSMKAMNSYIIDKNVAMQSAGQDAQAAGAKWTQQVDPRVWALTTSPDMGKKWGPQLGRNKIRAAFDYMTPEEQQAVISNLPASVLGGK